LEGGEDTHYPDMFRKIVSYLMTGETSCYADELFSELYGTHGFGDKYGMGAATAFGMGEDLVENDVYSYKIDFSER
jgi:hypothetical protein